MLPPPFSSIPIEGLSARAQLIRKATQKLPYTAEGLPVGFYRTDMLGGDAAQGTANELQNLSSAFVELSYEHGYPTLPTGDPFWHRLEFEPGLAFGAFQIYLELAQSGPRELTLVAQNQELARLLGLQMGRQATQADLLLQLTEYAALYYWKARSRAYDLFKEAAYRHIRVQRAMQTEEHHYVLSERLLKNLQVFLESPKFVADMTPKLAIEALKTLVGIQRVSAGLPAAGPLSTKDTPEATQFEAIFRQILSKEGTQGHKAQAALASGGKRAVDKLLEDPLTARQFQELVIKVTTVKYGPDSQNSALGPNQNAIIDVVPEDVEFHGDLIK